MEHSPSWKGISSSDSRNSLHSMEPKGSLPHSTRTRQLSSARLNQSTSSKTQWLNLQLTLYYATSNHSNDDGVAIPKTELLYGMIQTYVCYIRHIQRIRYFCDSNSPVHQYQCNYSRSLFMWFPFARFHFNATRKFTPLFEFTWQHSV
jgi:hypothetical protein